MGNRSLYLNCITHGERPNAWVAAGWGMDSEVVWKRLVTAAAAPAAIASDRERRALLSLAMTVGTTVSTDSVGCSITEAVETGFRTPVASNALALDLDSAQYADDDGPCIAACREGVAHAVDVMAHEQSYREFAHVALAHGVRSSLSLPLSGAGRPSALNLYARTSSAFDAPRARSVAELLARCASALLVADPYAALRSPRADDALADQEDGTARFNPRRSEDARIIASALQVLAERGGVNEHQAFAEMVRRSVVQDRSVAALARDLLAGAPHPKSAT